MKIAKYFLSCKKHVLIEKPMTQTVLQAKKLISLAKRNKVILQVGHLERFNPVLYNLLDKEKNTKEPTWFEDSEYLKK